MTVFHFGKGMMLSMYTPPFWLTTLNKIIIMFYILSIISINMIAFGELIVYSYVTQK